MDPRSEWLIGWCDRMIEKNGHPKYGVDWCRKLAYFMGEAGNNAPSIEAIEVAKRWESNNPETGEDDA